MPLAYDADESVLGEPAAAVPITGHVAPSTLNTDLSFLSEPALLRATRHPFVACPGS